MLSSLISAQMHSRSSIKHIAFVIAIVSVVINILILKSMSQKLVTALYYNISAYCIWFILIGLTYLFDARISLIFLILFCIGNLHVRWLISEQLPAKLQRPLVSNPTPKLDIEIESRIDEDFIGNADEHIKKMKTENSDSDSSSESDSSEDIDYEKIQDNLIPQYQSKNDVILDKTIEGNLLGLKGYTNNPYDVL
jgi:hypothetical protein